MNLLRPLAHPFARPLLIGPAAASLVACQDKPEPAAAAPLPIIENNQLRYPAGHPQLRLLETAVAVQAQSVAVDLPARLVWELDTWGNRCARVEFDKPVHELQLRVSLLVDLGDHVGDRAALHLEVGLPLVEAWAMTETGAAACIMANHEPRHVGTHCFGKPESFVQVRLVDDAGQDVPVGEPGELLVRSSGPDPRVMGSILMR